MEDNKDNKSIETESDEQGPTIELDDLLNESDEQTFGNESQKGMGKKRKGKKYLWLLIVTGLLFLSTAGGYFLGNGKIFFSNSNENIKQSLSAANYPQQQKSSQDVIKKEETLEFKSFVIPFKQSGKFAYVSLSIIFKLPDKKAKRKMILEKNWMRAMIYDTVKKKINISEETSSSQLLKTIIIRAVHDTLSAAGINDFEIKDFQAV